MKALKNGQVKIGAVFSYLLIIFNSLYAVFLTPFIIGQVGTESYGVYKTISSLAATMMVMDFGIGGTVQRYIAKYRASNEDEKIPGFLAMAIIISIGLNLLLALVAVIMFFCITPMYGGSFTAEQLALARQLFILLSINSLIVVFENVFNGIIAGCNHFIFGNGLRLFLLLIRVISILLLLSAFSNVIVIACIFIACNVLALIAAVVYTKKVLKIGIKYDRWDGSLFFEAGKYTLLMFLTSIASQFFSNVDNIVIGAMRGPTYVSIYSIALMFFSMFQSLSGGIAGVMLPTVTNTLNQPNGMQKVSSVIIRAGKVQFILLGAALTGFLCIGQDFISVWMGPGYEDVYIIALILLIPSMFELCINVCHSVLRAQNRLGFRTGITFASAILNAVLTFVLVGTWSYIGAAVATACSYIICSLIGMNIYYSRVIKLPMLRIYGAILGRVCLCLAVAGGGLYIFSRYVYGSWMAIVANIIVFCVLYGIMLFFVGLDAEERTHIPLVNRFLKKNN